MKVSRIVNIIRVSAVMSLLPATGLTADTKSSVEVVSNQEKRQIENEWGSTSKKDHKGPNTYEFRYDVENAPSNNIQYRMEERHPNGSVVGSYAQVQPDGNVRVVSYVADNDGVKTYVKNNGATPGNGDQYVAEGSSLDPVQRVSSQILQTGLQSQQQHKSPLFDKYHRPTPSSSSRVDNAHVYHQQRTNIDPSSFRPEDSQGYQETHQPFVGDHLKDKLHSSYAEYRVPTATASPGQFVQGTPLTVLPYNLQGPTASPVQPTHPPSHYVLNVPPLPSLGDNSPLPLLPGQQPLPITPDRGPIMIQLQQPPPPGPTPQANYQYQPTQLYQQQARVSPQLQQQLIQQQYQQQPVRVQPPAHLVPQQQQQTRLASSQLPQQQQQQTRLAASQLQQQPQQQSVRILSPTPQQQQQQQQQARLAAQQVVPQQVHPIQYQPLPNAVYQHPPQLLNTQQQQQQHAVHIPQQQQQQYRGQQSTPLQYFHQPNPATTVEQYRQQLQLQAAESEAHPVFVLPPDDRLFDFAGKTFHLKV
ncbi:putative mediator of RNA polymerase II transcription subunit 26 [Adelges cooleyi]|uniref:putative mediator of RNA polymerase II transcription subunit 26 n=1 Tax=Adelges cooleyi TaxID=133065 RepID=UPI00218027ED|nr:putative mediator of RNA polymerase II transcription subunit 26 [Adelges cooleyi]